MRRRLSGLALALGILLAAAFVAGCGGEEPAEQPTPTSGSQATEQPTPTSGGGQPTEQPTPTSDSQPTEEATPSGAILGLEEYAEFNCYRFPVGAAPYFSDTWGEALSKTESDVVYLKSYEGPLSNGLKLFHELQIKGLQRSADEYRKKNPDESYNEAQYEAFIEEVLSEQDRTLDSEYEAFEKEHSDLLAE